MKNEVVVGNLIIIGYFILFKTFFIVSDYETNHEMEMWQRKSIQFGQGHLL